MTWEMIFTHGVATMLGVVLGTWLAVRSMGKVDTPLPPPQKNAVDELAPPSGNPSPTAMTDHYVDQPVSDIPNVDLSRVVPQFGMPELRTNYGGAWCANDGAEVRLEETYVFIPISNGSPGSGLVICQRHAGEVAEHAEEIEDPADV